jgi:hypothetical protein
MAAQTYDAVIGLAVCIVAAGILPEASFYNFLAFVIGWMLVAFRKLPAIPRNSIMRDR